MLNTTVKKEIINQLGSSITSTRGVYLILPVPSL